MNTEQTKTTKSISIVGPLVCVCAGNPVGRQALLCPTGREPWELQKTDGASFFFVRKLTWHAEAKIFRFLEREMHTPTPTPSADKSEW